MNKQVVGCSEDIPGKVLYGSTACIAVMLASVVQCLKSSSSSSSPEVISSHNEMLRRILSHSIESGLVDHLCLCLALSGSSLISGSSDKLHAACEACRALWSIVEASEILYVKENAYHFPLYALQSPSLLRLDLRNHDRGSWLDTESAKVVDAVTKAFLGSKAVQVALYYCFHQRLEASLCAGIQVSVFRLTSQNSCSQYIYLQIASLFLFQSKTPRVKRPLQNLTCSFYIFNYYFLHQACIF